MNYEIKAIMIDLKANPKFSAVDMFIRMNQSPCNISENTFEMWNSYDIVHTLEYIKEVSKYDLFKQYGNRMKEEELVAVLSYMDYIKINIENVRTFLRIYLFTENKDKANERIEVKLSINNKQAITHFLENLEPNSEEEKKFIKSIQSIEEFINKLKILTDNHSKKLIKIVNPYVAIPRKANMKDYYVLWLILTRLDIHIIKTYQEEILKDLEGLFKFMKNMLVGKNENDFINYIDAIIKQYQK